MQPLLLREQHRRPGPAQDPDPPAGSCLPTRAERVAAAAARVASYGQAGPRAGSQSRKATCARCGADERGPGGYCRACRREYQRGYVARRRQSAA